MEFRRKRLFYTTYMSCVEYQLGRKKKNKKNTKKISPENVFIKNITLISFFYDNLWKQTVKDNIYANGGILFQWNTFCSRCYIIRNTIGGHYYDIEGFFSYISYYRFRLIQYDFRMPIVYC